MLFFLGDGIFSGYWGCYGYVSVELDSVCDLLVKVNHFRLWSIIDVSHGPWMLEDQESCAKAAKSYGWVIQYLAQLWYFKFQTPTPPILTPPLKGTSLKGIFQPLFFREYVRFWGSKFPPPRKKSASPNMIYRLEGKHCHRLSSCWFDPKTLLPSAKSKWFTSNTFCKLTTSGRLYP